MLLEEADLWDSVEKKVTMSIDVVVLTKHNKKVVKVKQIVLDWMKDHLILDITKEHCQGHV
jgi:3-phosphoglycerate kinase